MAGNDTIPSQEAIADRLKRMPDKVSETYRTKLGSYRGLEASMILHPSGGTEVVLDGATRCREQLMRDNPGPRAVLNALERLSEGYDYDIRRNKAEIALKEGQLRDFEARLGKPFAHEEYQSQLTDLRDQLKLALSEHPPEGLPPVAELAEKIKTLRASVTVEAAPERTVRKSVRAERPVTARIRERMAEAEQQAVVTTPEPAEAMPEPVKAPEPVSQVIALQKPDEETPPANMPVTPAMYLERPPEHARQVTRRRQADGAQLRLF